MIELVAYLAIFSAVSVLAIESLVSSMKNFSDLRVSEHILSSAQVGMDRMAYEIRRAKSVDESKSTFGTNTGKLVLNTTDDQGSDTTISFFLQNGMLEISEGDAAGVALTRNDTPVTQFSVNELSAKHGSGVKVDLTLGGEGASAEHFENTILFRNQES
ncbi:MAG TPA: hypothetical protein VFM02_02245 [Candidatus Paceibacterota bacterium]|nr:hypothetical protein [Candidatus Paceibacterota bacterium]